MIAPTLLSFLAGMNLLVALAMAFGNFPVGYVISMIAVLWSYKIARRKLGRPGFWVLYGGTVSGLIGFVGVILLVDLKRLGPAFACLGMSGVSFMLSAWEARLPVKPEKEIV